MRLAPALLPSLFLGTPAASAQTPKDGAYVLADTAIRKYTLYQDSLQYQPHWSGYYGGMFEIKDLAWNAGRASFCIFGRHVWGDYGWVDFDECLTGSIAQGQRVNLPPYPSDDFFWSVDLSRNLLAYTKQNAALRALLTLHQDTVRLSFWWIHAIGAESETDLFLPGNIEEKDVDSLTRRLARRHLISTSRTVERVTVQYHSMAFVPEGTVGLDPLSPALRRPRWPNNGRPPAYHDLLGRLRDLRAR